MPEPTVVPTANLRWYLPDGWGGYGPFGVDRIDAAGNTDYYVLQQQWSDGSWRLIPGAP